MKRISVMLLFAFIVNSIFVFPTAAAEQEGNNDFIRTATYFAENFNSFVSTANPCTVFPNGWYRYNSGPVQSMESMYSTAGVSGVAGDNAIKFASATAHQRILRPFNSYVNKGDTFFVEFDVYRGGKGGFYLSILPVSDLEYNAAIHGAGGDHSFDSNITIGMHSGIIAPAAGRSVAPKLGYAQRDATNNLIDSFTDASLTQGDEGYYCNVESGQWRHVKLKVAPVSGTETILTVSVDGGKEFVKTTPLNFTTKQAAGISLFSYRSTDEQQDLRFDNIDVYSGAYIPKVTGVKYELSGVSQVPPVSQLTDKINIEFNTEISSKGIEDKARLIRTSDNYQVPCSVSASDNKRNIYLIPNEILNGNAEYTIEIGRIASLVSEEIVMTDPYIVSFKTTEGLNLEVTGYNFSVMGKIVSDNISSVPYGIDKININFNLPVEITSLEGKIQLKRGDKDVPFTYDVSADGKTVSLSLGQYLLDENCEYTIVLKGGITSQRNQQIALKKDVATVFKTNSQSVSIPVGNYYSEDFSNYISTGNGEVFPGGWYRISSSGHIALSGMYSEAGASGKTGDTSIRFANTDLHQRIMTPLDTYVPLGQTVNIDFDVYRKGDSGFYVCLIPECDLEYNNAIHGSTGDHTIDANLTIGMHPSSSNYVAGATRSIAPKLGYATAKATSTALQPFTDSLLHDTDDSYFCKVESNAWHSVRLKAEPVSSTETVLTVSVDGGKEYTKSTPLDFMTRRIAGICIFAMRPLNSGQTKSDYQDVRFDNIKVYSMATVKRPEVKTVTAIKYDGSIQDISSPISRASTEIDLAFDTVIDGENLVENIKLYQGFTEVPCKYELSSSGTNVKIAPKGVLNSNQSYNIKISGNVKSRYDDRMTFGKEDSIYFRTEAESVLKALTSNITKSNGEALFTVDLLKVLDEKVRYTILIAEYDTQSRVINGKTMNLDRLIKVSYAPVEFDSSENGIFSRTIRQSLSQNTKKIVGYLFEYPGNKCIATAKLEM